MRPFAFALGELAAAILTRHAGLAQGLQRGGTPQTDRVTPVNSAATPPRYQIIRDCGNLYTAESILRGVTKYVAASSAR